MKLPVAQTLTLLVSILTIRVRRSFGAGYCEETFGLSAISHGTPEECENYSKYPNVMFLGGVYCFNNGTGICKAFAGQFEFYFNTFSDTIIGPAPKSKHVSFSGQHSRIPVSYNVDGKIIYADRSINWAKSFKETMHGNNISLLSMTDFNWCQYTKNDWWPYKTAIKDSKSNGRFYIYFYNRQSCIYDTVKKKRQHFNTRFMGNSSLRIDLENNPLIFAMEDYLAQEVRLVKNKRQHWYEVPFETIELNGRKNIRYFVEMSADQKLPCMINGTSAPLLSNDAFRRYSGDTCLSDDIHKRSAGEKNSGPLWHHCGADEVETADYPLTHYYYQRGQVIEVDLHNLPKHPKVSESFYGVNYESYVDWTTFAAHGYSFTATTTIPIDGYRDRVRVISLFSDFHQSQDNKYDENYPMPMMADYTAYYNRFSGLWDSRERRKKAIRLKNLNYVDDIAYLHKCHTILVIFGPLYSELPADNFHITTRGPIGSIDELGSNELINAAFAEPFRDTLYFYHRLNYISKHKYTCASKNGPDREGSASSPLVTAVMLGSYMPRQGKGQPEVFKKEPDKRMNLVLREETFFQISDVLKVSPLRPEAPNPSLYKEVAVPPPEPITEGSTSWVYMVVVIGALICVSLCMICTITLRKRRRRRQKAQFDELQRSRIDGSPSRLSRKNTTRSSTVPASQSAATSVRSSLKSERLQTVGAPSSASTVRTDTFEPSQSSKRKLQRTTSLSPTASQVYVTDTS